jgi:hypothetical protein
MKMHSPPHPGSMLREFYLTPLDLTCTAAAEGLGEDCEDRTLRRPSLMASPQFPCCPRSTVALSDRRDSGRHSRTGRFRGCV